MPENPIYKIEEEIFLPVTDIVCPGVIPNAYMIGTKGNFYNNLENCFAVYGEGQYQGVSLRLIDGGSVWMHIHRILMITFKYVQGFENLEVNHINGKKHDNDINNLEWVTHAQNMRHAAQSGLISKHRFTDDEVRNIIELYINDKLGYTEIAKIYNCTKTSIYEILNGKSYKYISEEYNIIIRPARLITIEERAEMCELYNNGYGFDQIAKILDLDRSTIGKILREISRDNTQDFITTPLKIFTDDQVKFMCLVFSNNKGEGFTKSYKIILKFLHLDHNDSIRKGINNIFNRKTYKKISSLYEY